MVKIYSLRRRHTILLITLKRKEKLAKKKYAGVAGASTSRFLYIHHSRRHPFHQTAQSVKPLS